MSPPNRSRNRQQLNRDGGDDATALIWAIRTGDADAAAVLTVGWTRRHLLDVTLELASRHTSTSRARKLPDADRGWTRGEAARAHITYSYGNRSEWACEGNRIYERQQRAERQSVAS